MVPPEVGVHLVEARRVADLQVREPRVGHALGHRAGCRRPRGRSCRGCRPTSAPCSGTRSTDLGRPSSITIADTEKVSLPASAAGDWMSASPVAPGQVVGDPPGAGLAAGGGPGGRAFALAEIGGRERRALGAGGALGPPRLQRWPAACVGRQGSGGPRRCGIAAAVAVVVVVASPAVVVVVVPGLARRRRRHRARAMRQERVADEAGADERDARRRARRGRRHRRRRSRRAPRLAGAVTPSGSAEPGSGVRRRRPHRRRARSVDVATAIVPVSHAVDDAARRSGRCRRCGRRRPPSRGSPPRASSEDEVPEWPPASSAVCHQRPPRGVRVDLAGSPTGGVDVGDAGRRHVGASGPASSRSVK